MLRKLLHAAGAANTPFRALAHLCVLVALAMSLPASAQPGHDAPFDVADEAPELMPQSVARLMCGSATSCLRQGQRARVGTGDTALDPQRAVTLFEAACSLGEAEGCSDYGVMLATGNGTSADDVRARWAFERSCNGENLMGCFNLSHMLGAGRGGPIDAPRAEALLQETCGMGMGTACYNIFTRLEVSAPSEARQYARRACSLGIDRACMVPRIQAANAREHQRHPLMTLAQEQADCALGRMRACNNAGLLLSRRGSAEWNPAAALALFTRACDARNGVACYNLGTLLAEMATQAGDFNNMRAAFARACALHKYEACSLMADSWTSVGEGVLRPDYAYATAMWIYLCDRGYGESCAAAGRAILEQSAPRPSGAPSATILLRRACRMGAHWGCWQLARHLHDTGARVGANILARQACNRGHAPSCLLMIDWHTGPDNTHWQYRRAWLERRACLADPLERRACPPNIAARAPAVE